MRYILKRSPIVPKKYRKIFISWLNKNPKKPKPIELVEFYSGQLEMGNFKFRMPKEYIEHV